MSNILISDAAGAAMGNSTMIMIIYVVVIVAFFYFAMIRPQKNERKKLDAMIASLTTGDTVLTTSGFYGTVIDITDDTVIVEFGNNKNCRIPMQKTAIAQCEHPGDAEA